MALHTFPVNRHSHPAPLKLSLVATADTIVIPEGDGGLAVMNDTLAAVTLNIVNAGTKVVGAHTFAAGSAAEEASKDKRWFRLAAGVMTLNIIAL